MEVPRHRLTKRWNADRRCVAVMAVAQGLDACLDDMSRRGEVRLADAEIDDVAALRRKRAGAGENSEGVLLADPIEGGHDTQHGLDLPSDADRCRDSAVPHETPAH